MLSPPISLIFTIKIFNEEFTCYYERDLERGIHLAYMSEAEFNAFFWEHFPEEDSIYTTPTTNEELLDNQAWHRIDEVFCEEIKKRFGITISEHWCCDSCFEPFYSIP